ncbi:unnamed protein product [Pleuronectes platessa]|uniref:Uncharacterized protein n=1 Tax=Pleuronectes platessa TaxID=8262 RepID=A0A9N7YRJ6_PLEPL|nr:unnamed protein product [Pleuronectes platessa]
MSWVLSAEYDPSAVKHLPSTFGRQADREPHNANIWYDSRTSKTTTSRGIRHIIMARAHSTIKVRPSAEYINLIIARGCTDELSIKLIPLPGELQGISKHLVLLTGLIDHLPVRLLEIKDTQATGSQAVNRCLLQRISLLINLYGAAHPAALFFGRICSFYVTQGFYHAGCRVLLFSSANHQRVSSNSALS